MRHPPRAAYNAHGLLFRCNGRVPSILSAALLSHPVKRPEQPRSLEARRIGLEGPRAADEKWGIARGTD